MEFFLRPLPAVCPVKEVLLPDDAEDLSPCSLLLFFQFVPIHFSLSVYFLLSHVFSLASSLPSGEDKLNSYATALARFQCVPMERHPQNCLICPL